MGLLTTLVVHPIDVARTLIQAYANDEAPWLVPFLIKLFREKGYEEGERERGRVREARGGGREGEREA